jgi:hypothetical protein
MKLAIFSDLHLDHSNIMSMELDIPEDVDGIINAGDTHPYKDIRIWFRDTIMKDYPKAYYWEVPGNHDSYKGGWDVNNNYWEDTFVAQTGKIMTVAGATLWTKLDKPLDWFDYKNNLIDCKFMKGWSEEEYKKAHEEHKNFLFDEELSADIIITHHAPSYQSVHPRYGKDPINRFFVNDLDAEILAMKHPPKLWIFGHVHDKFDYMIGSTRVVCNPRGYPGEGNFKNYKPVIIEI